MANESIKQARSEHLAEFIARVRLARQARGFTMEQIAKFLGIPGGKDHWKIYEERSYLQQYLMGDFCKLTGCDLNWLVTGEGKAPKPDKS